MGLADIAAAAGSAEQLRQLFAGGPEAPLPKDIEELEDERDRLRSRIQSLEEEGALSGRRWLYVAIGIGGAVLIYFLLFK